MEKRIIIVDLDGCLANADHREHFVLGEKPDWDRFYIESANDTVNTTLLALLNQFDPQFEVWVISGRAEEYRKIFQVWLHNAGLIYEKLILRARKDFRADEVLKELVITEGEIHPDEVFCAFDARPRAVEMWRSHGIACFAPVMANFDYDAKDSTTKEVISEF